MGDAIPFPPHAYVPGQNARHPEGWFDEIKQSVTPSIPTGQLHMTTAWAAGLAYFDAGYFWECHEVLEAVWMRAPKGTVEREMVQALIQLANARLKLKMKRRNAARRLCDMVNAHLARCPAELAILGLMVGDVQSWVRETQEAVEMAKDDL